MDNIDKLNKLYEDLGYFDIYGWDFFIFIILIFIIIVIYAFSIAMENAGTIKNDWVNQRCKPKNILFAGFINKPNDETIFGFTGDNFSYCLQNILTGITGSALDPFTYIISSLTTVYADIANSIAAIRAIVSNIRDSIMSIISDIMARVINIAIPFQNMYIVFNDIMAKINGVLSVLFMYVFGAYLTLQALLGAILQLIIYILIALAFVIVALWAGFFSWPLAFAFSLAFMVLAAIMISIIYTMTNVLKIHTDGLPSLPSKPSSSCFDENTNILMFDNSTKKISEIELGDILHNNNMVNAIFKLSSLNQEIYKVGSITVSGEHYILYNNKMIKVKECPISAKYYDYSNKYLYSLNTNKKTIPILSTEGKEYIFCDWDDLYDDKLNKVINKLHCKLDISKDSSNINKYLDIGFCENTIVCTKHMKKFIADINIGDILDDSDNNIVYGIVKKINKIEDEDDEDDEDDCKMTYNLLTHNKFFTIYNKKNATYKKYLDYNSCMDNFLDENLIF